MNYKNIKAAYDEAGYTGLTIALTCIQKRDEDIKEQLDDMVKTGFIAEEFAEKVETLAKALLAGSAIDIYALIQRDVTPVPGGINSDIPALTEGDEDVCPECEGMLEFPDGGGDIFDDGMGGFFRRWECPDCGKTGYAKYEGAFRKHAVDN